MLFNGNIFVLGSFGFNYWWRLFSSFWISLRYLTLNFLVFFKFKIFFYFQNLTYFLNSNNYNWFDWLWFFFKYVFSKNLRLSFNYSVMDSVWMLSWVIFVFNKYLFFILDLFYLFLKYYCLFLKSSAKGYKYYITYIYNLFHNLFYSFYSLFYSFYSFYFNLIFEKLNWNKKNKTMSLNFLYLENSAMAYIYSLSFSFFVSWYFKNISLLNFFFKYLIPKWWYYIFVSILTFPFVLMLNFFLFIWKSW